MYFVCQRVSSNDIFIAPCLSLTLEARGFARRWHPKASQVQSFPESRGGGWLGAAGSLSAELVYLTAGGAWPKTVTFLIMRECAAACHNALLPCPPRREPAGPQLTRSPLAVLMHAVNA